MLVAVSCRAETQIGSFEGPRGERADVATDAVADADASTGMSAAEIYDGIVDSIVFISSDEGSGTGIVIEGGWILTNAHVVERLETVRIGRSDGVDLGEHAVYGLDWIFDLALVGPVDDDELIPFGRTSSADLGIGDPVMLIGFPDEPNEAATPTLTSGIVSRRRQPALGNYPFVQVDATIAPGQSGGALVDMNGNLMGISGLEFGEGEFGLAFEADAMWPRIDDLLEAPSEIVPETNEVFTLSDEVGPRRSFGFLIEVDASGRTNLAAISDDDIFLDITTLGGATLIDQVDLADPFFLPSGASDKVYFIDELLDGGETLEGDLTPGLYQVRIGSFGEGPATVDITSDNALRPFRDVEEGAELPVGLIVEGEFDWSGDSDRWELPLVAGERVTITADGIADTVLAVRLDGLPVASSDDEFIGLFGTGAQLTFEAPADGVYEVEVGTFDDARWGYLIEVVTG